MNKMPEKVFVIMGRSGALTALHGMPALVDEPPDGPPTAWYVTANTVDALKAQLAEAKSMQDEVAAMLLLLSNQLAAKDKLIAEARELIQYFVDTVRFPEGLPEVPWQTRARALLAKLSGEGS